MTARLALALSLALAGQLVLSALATTPRAVLVVDLPVPLMTEILP